MKSTAFGLFIAGLTLIAACEGSEVRRRLGADATLEDTREDADDGDAGDGDATGEATLAFWFVGRDGAIGRGAGAIGLAAGDEPEAYVATRGFQIDVALETTGVEAGEDVRLYVDDVEVATGRIAVNSGLGHATFEEVTLPEHAGPIVVKVATQANGEALEEVKDVTLDLGPCLIAAELALGPEGCVEVAVGGLVAPTPAARVTATLLTGECDVVSGNATMGQRSVALGEVAFTADGTADLFIPIDPSDAFEGDVLVDLTATHPTDPSRNGSTTVTGRLDQVAPALAWVAPAAEITALTPADDDDQDPANGIQYAVEVAVTAGEGEPSTATLFVGDRQVGEVETTGSGTVSFGLVTFEDGPTTLRVVVTDGCGNDASLTLAFDVVSRADTIAILTPDDGAVLLALADVQRNTTEVYDTTFQVAAVAAEVGTTIEVLCQPATEVDPAAWTHVGSYTLPFVEPDGVYAVPVSADVRVVGQASRCIARMDTPSALASAPVRVTFAIPAPTVLIEAPVDGSCVSSDAIAFSGVATELDGRTLTMSGSSPAGLIEDATFATVGTGAAAGDWSASYPVGGDGQYRFTLVGVDRFGNAASSKSVAVSVDRAAPTIAITGPATSIDGSTVPDPDPAPGYQVTVTTTASDAASLSGGELCLAVNGGTPTCVAMAAAVSFPGVTLDEGDNLLTLTGSDGCGNAATPATRTVTLTVANPIAIVSPANGATLLASGDGNPATARVYETTMTVDADRAAVGASIVVECRPEGGGAFTEVGARTVAGTSASYLVSVAIDTAVLGTRVECRARVDRPVPGTSAVIALTVGLPAPTLALTAPSADRCFNADIPTSGTASGLDGRSVTASLVAPSGSTTASGSAAVANGAWATTIALGNAADGSYGVRASASDTFGNPATSAVVAVVVDRSAPTAGLTSPGADVAEADDVSTLPGVQVDVVASLQDARAGGEVCLAVNGAAPTCQPRTSGATTFAAVTLQPGDNTLTVSGRDACGNAAIPLTRTTTLNLNAPTVAITTPATDVTTLALVIDIVVSVADVDLAPRSDATVTLLAGGVGTGLTPTNGGNGTYTFQNVPLAAGAATTFTARATLPGTGAGVSGPRVVTQKNQQPTIALTAPAEGTLFVLASTACAAGQSNCVTTATAAAQNAEDGSAAVLDVTCGATTTSYNAVVAGGAASFTNVVLTNGQSCTLTPKVTDILAQAATGTAVHVTVDRTPPTVSITQPPSILESADDASPTTPGIQHALTANVGGVAAGAVVSAVLSWTAGTPQTRTLTHTVTTTTPDGGSYLATFQDAATPGLVTWPEGLVDVVVSVSDVSGNPGSDELAVSVNAGATVRITGPALAPADTCGGGCAAGTVCQDGACWIAWGTGASRQLVAVASGLLTTSNNIRVCSDHPSLAGSGAPSCASPASATGAYRQVRLASTSGGTTVLDLSTVLPEGAQRLVVEIQPVTAGGWVSSLDALNASERERRVLVDLQAPSVTAIASPSDTLPPAGTLNIAEQAAIPRAYDIRFTTTEAGLAEVRVNGTVAATQAVPAGESTLRATLPEGVPDVWVVMTDAVGNRSPATPGQGALTYRPTVDVTAPTLAFTRPAKSPLIAGDVLDVVLTSDAEGRTVTVFDGGVQKAQGTVTSGSVTFADATFDILSEGSHTLTASVSDAAQNPTTAATSPATVLVDTVPPTGTITAPTQGRAFVEADDADPGATGFQVSVGFSTGGGAATWTLSTASGCTSSWTGCQAPIVKASGAVTNPGGAEPVRLVTLDTTAAQSWHKIILQTFDAAGNTASTEVGVSVTVSCAVSFLNLPASGWYGAATCGSPTSCPNVSVDVAFAGDCGNRVQLFDGATSLGTSGNNPTSPVSFSITVTNGVPLALEAKAYQGSVGNLKGSTGVVPIGVDLVAPQVAFISTTTGGFVTPAEGESVTWGYADDLDTGAPGMQFNAAVRVTDTNADGGAITLFTATSTAGTVNLSPTNGSIPLALSGSSPITQTLLGMTLADHLTHTVTVTARDKAGNTDSSTFTATVDVTQPASVPVTSFTVDPRRPRFSISWTAIGIDGAPASAYEVRYSALPIVSENDWDAACDASLVFGSDPMPPPATPGATMSVAVGGPDTRALSDACKLDVRFDDGEPPSDVALYFAVRAFDAVGNGSALDDASTVAVSNAELWNELSIVRFDNSAGIFGSAANGPLITRRGNVLGDLTGDGRAEWAVNSPNTNGFCVFMGQASQPDDTTISALSSATHACLIGAAAGSLFAGATQTGHLVVPLGDVNGDGLGDFGVSGRLTTGTTGGESEGYVVVYLGRSGALPDLTAPQLRIRGIRSTGGGLEYVGLCSAGDFDGAGGVATDDIAIGEPFISAVHVIPGQTSWTTTTSLSYDLTTAGTLTTLGAWTVATTGTWGVTPGVPAGSPPVLGLRCVPAGDILPTPAGLGTGAKDDLLVLQSGSNDARVFLFPGRTFAAGASESVSENSGVTAEDGRSLRLRQELTGFIAGFGSSIQGGADFTADGMTDVMVAHVGRRTGSGRDGKAVYLFDGAKLPALIGQDVRVNAAGDPVLEAWTGTNGWILRASLNTATPYVARLVGNFDGWTSGGRATPDLLIGDESGIGAFLYSNKAGAGTGVPFPVLDGEIVNRYRPPATTASIGIWNDGSADLTGDGLGDIITGSNLGEVLIVH